MVKYFLQIRQIFRKNISIGPNNTAIDRYDIKLLRKKILFSKWTQSNIKQVFIGSFLFAYQNSILANFY